MRRKKKDKVYCSQCRFYDDDYCDTHHKTMEQEYFAPGHTIKAREMCHSKNRENDCTDFKQK